MYTMYANSQCFYNDESDADELKLTSPTLEFKDNAAGSLTFTLPPSNIVYSTLTSLSTVITVKRNFEEIWCGRPISEKKDFNGNRQITCEGEMAYLNDTIQPQHEYENPTVTSFLTAVLGNHNAVVGDNKKIYVGIVTVTASMEDESGVEDPDDILVYTDFNTTYEAIKTKLIDKLEGHIRIRKENGVRYLDYLADYDGVSDQIIEFGRNLMDFVINYDETEFCTVVIPLGEAYDITAEEGYTEYLDITDVNAGKNYLINDSSYAEFGWIQRVEHFDTIDDENELKQAGIDFLQDKQFGEMTLEVSAIDLCYLEVNVDGLKPLQQVRVKSVPHGLDKLFPITDMKIPLDNPANTTFTLGKVTSMTLSDYSTGLTEAVKAADKTTITRETTNAANAAVHNATTGVITTIRTEARATSDLIISDAVDYTTADRIYRWNTSGLMYTDDAGQTWQSVLSMDGEINGDLIEFSSANGVSVRIQNGSVEFYHNTTLIGTVTVNDDHDGLLLDASKLTVNNDLLATLNYISSVTADAVTVRGVTWTADDPDDPDAVWHTEDDLVVLTALNTSTGTADYISAEPETINQEGE